LEEKMTDEEYQKTQDSLLILSRDVSHLDLVEFRRRAARAESVGSILDPTIYRMGHRRLDAIRNLAEAAQTVKNAFEKLRTMVALESEEAIDGRPFNP
jgi:hypothetical protein